MSDQASSQSALNPAALPVEAAAALLARAGGAASGEVTVDMLRADIEAGAPTNADGTINLMHYAAWLAREMANRSGGASGGD